MDEFKNITNASSVVKISACLEKIFKKITESREKKISEQNIKEIEFLKTQCKSDLVQLSLLSSQTFVRLVEGGVLDASNVLTMLISMLPNSSSTQYTTITEGIVSILLLGLRRKVALLKENENFQCQFGLKTQQHPLITLLQSSAVNMNDVANKIVGICNHHDQQVKVHSIEYLRPVLLYILCNPQTLPDSKTIWTGLLSLSKTNLDAKQLMQEIFSWSKFNSSTTCLFTSILLIEAIEHCLNVNDFDTVIDLSIFQALIVNNLTKFGIDPRPSLHCLLRVLHSTREHTVHHYNVLLILLAESLHLLSPNYLHDLLRIIAFIIVQECCGNQYILNMCLDGIIQWMSQTAFIPAEGLALAHQVVRKILERGKETESAEKTKVHTIDLKPAQVRYYHPDIAVAFDLAKLVESFDESEFKDVFTFVDALNVKANSMFCQRLNLFLRALFLSQEPSIDCWFKIYEAILEIIKVNSGIAYDFLMTYIFKLAGEQQPEIQMELLRGLPSFAVSKDNIPMILNTIRNLTAENGTFCMDLYLRLWRIEPRTYPFLIKLLSTPQKDSSKRWEFEIAKTHTIREICYDKPTQHGSDLVSHLSDTLNSCTDDAGDLATSYALDAIVALCNSHTVNIISTWRVLSSKFRHERRPKALKSLYRFFAHIPLLHTPTLEYEQLVDEALEQLWLTVSRSDSEPELVREALSALKNFEIGSLLSMRHIPMQYRQDTPGVREFVGGREVVDLQQEMVPGEVWVHLLQKIRPECGAAAADLIAHHIYAEINGYRSGVYRLPEGKPEPRKLQGLFPQSPLRAVVSYVVGQARFGDHVTEPHVVTNALRAISKKFPKPIPPLDWCFLHSFFHLSFEARKYCLLIAKNQLLHSGTARRLLENFLVDFEPNCFEEDLLLLFSLLPEISNGVSLHILKNFAEKIAIYSFKESQLSGFTEGCLFEKFIDSVKYIFLGKCDIPEVLDIFTLIIERYMDSMDLDSRVTSFFFFCDCVNKVVLLLIFVVI
uniref:Uncharacterized protein KIAA1797 n=1 Tax=Bactrocera latifrons TaxID=174628 RepID=A0A0K8W5U7_BACLA